MSNNLVSQQFVVSRTPVSQGETIFNSMDSSSLPERPRGLMGPESNEPSLHHYSTTTKPIELMEHISIDPMPQSFLVSNMQMGSVNVNSNNMGPRQYQIPNIPIGGIEHILRNAGPGQFSLPVKRKSPMEPLHHNLIPQHSSLENKHVGVLEHRLWLQQTSGPNKRSLQMQYTSPTPVSQISPGANKKVIQVESVPSKAGPRSSALRNQASQKNPPSKIHNESFESVRSKMRESLTAALALVQQKEKISGLGKSSPREGVGHRKENDEAASDGGGFVSEGSREIICLIEDSSSNPSIVDQRAFHKTSVPVKSSVIQTLGYEGISAAEEFVQDELLQGNGLAWVMDSSMEMVEKREIQSAEKRKPHLKVVDFGQGGKSHQNLAFEIENELFRLFGGVNKKYKERGRSLLFNLKDRNNPALRERVMSGQIPPKQLCSMTPEDLASEELTQWRVAKAEEFAQMIVLPDSGIDMRRFVKKTHKGDIEVQVEHDDGGSVEVPVNANSFAPTPQNDMETKEASQTKPNSVKDRENTGNDKNNVKDKDSSLTFMVPPNDSSDLMLDDALKDAEFFPPIVSLDEFMESLNAEPPFENLSADAGKLMPIAEEDNSEAGGETKSSGEPTNDPAYSTTDKNDNSDEDFPKPEAKADDNVDQKPSENHNDALCEDNNSNVKSSDSHVKMGAASPASISKVEHVWEGILQLSLVTTCSVVGAFISCEKASTKEWPGSLEIKGRVRLDAFQKFLQGLPLSRSRAVMVLHFNLKEGQPESERSSLKEAADSYVLDERVGIAEPSSGVELYFCPPHKRMLEMLTPILQKDHVESLNSINIGLIGVVVWRKAHNTSSSSSTTSPTSTNNNYKHSSKKQHFTTRRKHHDTIATITTNMNANNITHKRPHAYSLSTHKALLNEDDDDVPPGFGPSSAWDEDDLPEFNFSGTTPSSQRSNRSKGGFPYSPVTRTPSRQVDQMRELVHKYGQTRSDSPRNLLASNLPTRPRNDDDDDIPEWQPSQLIPPQTFPMIRPHRHLVGQDQCLPHQNITTTKQPLQGSVNVNLSWHQQGQGQEGWWVPPVQGNMNSLPNGVQYYGTAAQPGPAWRDNAA